VTTAAEHDGGVQALRRELAHERRELAAAIGDLERSVALRRRLARRRLPIVLAVFASSFVVAGGLSAAVRASLRRRARPRERVLVRVGDFSLVRRSG
jgi:hypothetical protein